eukprot:2181866-Pyramimonas_sp.AAC.1
MVAVSATVRRPPAVDRRQVAVLTVRARRAEVYTCASAKRPRASLPLLFAADATSSAGAASRYPVPEGEATAVCQVPIPARLA